MGAVAVVERRRSAPGGESVDKIRTIVMNARALPYT